MGRGRAAHGSPTKWVTCAGVVTGYACASEVPRTAVGTIDIDQRVARVAVVDWRDTQARQSMLLETECDPGAILLVGMDRSGSRVCAIEVAGDGRLGRVSYFESGQRTWSGTPLVRPNLGRASFSQDLTTILLQSGPLDDGTTELVFLDEKGRVRRSAREAIDFAERARWREGPVVTGDDRLRLLRKDDLDGDPIWETRCTSPVSKIDFRSGRALGIGWQSSTSSSRAGSVSALETHMQLWDCGTRLDPRLARHGRSVERGAQRGQVVCVAVTAAGAGVGR